MAINVMNTDIPISFRHISFLFNQILKHMRMANNTYAARENEIMVATMSTLLYQFFHLAIWVDNSITVAVPR